MKHNFDSRYAGIVLGFLFIILYCSLHARAQPQGGGAIVAIDEGADFRGSAAGSGAKAQTGTTGASNKSTPARQTANRTKAKPPAKPTAAQIAARNKKINAYDGFIVGDKYTFLNFEVISAAKPYHTRDAKAGGASGLVQVEVLIDQNGSVLTTRARTGNKLLHPEAERAALESKFNKPTVYGKPARAMGFLVYRFGPAED
jgi:outer membrane biosynthesis protein TonB